MATDLPDLADQIDDYICIYEAAGGTMDTLAMFIFFFAIFLLFTIWLCKFLYYKYYKTNVVTSSDVSNLPILAPNGVVQNKSKTDDKLRRSEPKEILEKKITAKDFLSSKPSPMRNATGVTSQTPLMRKRLSRRSPGPEITPKRRTVPPPSNVVGPDTVSVTWISQVFRWLYSDLVIVNELLQCWVQTLNTTLASYVDENGVVCEIVRVLPESPAPVLANIYAEKVDPNSNDVLVTCDCECMPVLQMKTYRQVAGKVETSHYKATVSRFKGRLAATIHQLTLKGDLRVDGYPEIKVALNSIGPIKTLSQDETQLQDVVSEFVISAMRDSIYPLDLSVYATCPRALVMESPTMPMNLPLHYDSMASNMEMLNMSQANYQQTNGPATVSSGKRLLVKIVKGEGLMQAIDPYCVVEMDEPAQKNQTGARQGTSPFWDEHFLFELSPYSAELLFEVYDRPMNANQQPKFLGLGLVGIDELAVGMSSSQTLGLQPRPYETETVQGAITVEFVFIEGAQIPTGRRPYKLKEALKIDSNQQYRETQLQNGNSLSDVQSNNHNTYYNDKFSSAQLDNGNHINNFNNGISNQKSPVSRASSNSLNHHSTPTTTGSHNRPTYNSHNSYQLDSPVSPTITVNTQSSSATASPGGMATLSPKSAAAMQYRPNLNNNAQNVNSNLPNNSEPLTNGTEKRSRNIFGTIKKKLSRSKSRSKSMDYNDVNNIHTETRSYSTERGALGQSLSVPHNNNNNYSMSSNASNQSNYNTTFNKMNISRTSSLSEASAISGLSSASAKTFLHEDSTLVLETIENGVKRHFLVPISVAQRPRWRRKGTKLHIYNDHTFIAKHLSGSLLCDVCNRSIPRRPGKQGYECRDCLMKCHKPCHVRAPQQCMNSTILSTEFLKWNSGNVDRFIRKV